jgi:hypothetical protein
MSVNFEDEDYVRVYSRDTATTKKLGWEGRTVLWHLFRIVPKSGVLELGEGDDLVEVVASLCDLPEEVTKLGLERLASRGVTVRHAASLEIVRFVEAQNARRSDRLRAQDYRDRQKAEASALSEKKASASRNVTARHDSSLPASPPLALPCLELREDLVELELDICLPDLESFAPEPSKLPRQPSPHQAEAVQVFQAWQKATGHERAVMDPKRLNRLKARLREGHTVETLLAVLRNWRNDPWLAGSSGTTYDGIEQLFRDSAQVERLAALVAPVKAPAAISRFAPPVSPNVDFETKQRLASSRRVQAMMEGKF